MGARNWILTGLGLTAALGAEEPPRTPPSAGATVTVTAEAQPVEVTRTPAPVRIVDTPELERLGSRTLGELLTVLQPGSLMESGGPGSKASAFLNGTLSRNVVILLDGMRLNDPTTPSPDLGTLSLMGIARVELVLGPASVLYGSDAIGGVIALSSVGKGPEGFHGRTGLKAGTDSLLGAGAQVQLTRLQTWVSGGLEGLRQGSPLPGDTFRQAGAFLRAGTRLGESEWTAFYRNSGQTASAPFAVVGWPAVRDYQAQRETQARQEHWGLQLRWPLGPGVLLEGAAQAMSGGNGDPLEGGGRGQTRRDFRRAEALLTLHWTPRGDLRISGRLEGRSDTSWAKNYYDPSTFAAVPYRGEGRDLAAALEVRWNLAEGLDWVSGMRRDAGHRDLSRRDSGLRTRAGAGDAGTWRSGLNWRLAPEFRLYASAGSGFRMPTATEFALNAQAEGQDQRIYPILPERSRTLQAGATGIFGGHWEYRLEVQRTRLQDLLAYAYDTSFAFPPLFTSHYENRGAVRAQSVEGALGWRGGSQAAYGWDLVLRSQETRDLEHQDPARRFGSLENTAILRHPFFVGSLSAFVQGQAWRVWLRLDRVGPRYDLEDTGGSILPMRPYRDLALGLSFQAPRGLQLTLRGENLLQRRWSDKDWLRGRFDQEGDAALVFGFPAPAPRWTLGATWSW
ncbi:MAG: TonB-dependent receptor [Acidobacteria bacterium]|nr:TonB-dependent receptor [Acidobacteriota bacterium]